MLSSNLVAKCQTFFAGAAVFLNACLIFLIVKKSPKQLGSYRYLMIYISIFEIVYSLIDSVVSPTILSHGSTFAIVLRKTTTFLSEETLFILGCEWCGCFGAFMFIFAIQFIYRYLVVTSKSKILKSFDDWRMIFWILSPIILGTIWGSLAFVYLSKNSETEDEIRSALLSEIDVPLDNVVYMGATLYHKDSDGNKSIFVNTLIMISFKLTVLTVSFLCIFFFASLTLLEMRKVSTISTQQSKELDRIQSQAFYALISQSCIPVILMHFPCTIVFLASVFDFDLGTSGGISAITFAMFPAIDPLPVMLIIQNFRGTLISVVTTPVQIITKTRNV